MAFDGELKTVDKVALNKMTAEVFSKYLSENLAKADFKVFPPPRPQPYSFGPEPEPYDLYLLKRARARIAAGWTQKMMHDVKNDSVCAVGALLCAVQGTSYPHPHRESDEPIVERLASHVYGSASGLMGFNDTFGMTKERVLDLFDRAIRRLEERIQGRMRFDRYRYDPSYSRQQYLDSVTMV